MGFVQVSGGAQDSGFPRLRPRGPGVSSRLPPAAWKGRA